MANVVITLEQDMEAAGYCAYCDEPAQGSRGVTVQCLWDGDRSIAYRFVRVFSADPRIHRIVVPGFCLFVGAVVLKALWSRIPVMREDWFFLVAFPIVLLGKPIWRSLRPSWTQEQIRLPLCENHNRSEEETLAIRLKWPAWICLFAVVAAVVIYCVGIAMGKVDFVSGLAIMGIAAMLFFPIWLIAYIWVHFSRTRYGIRRANNDIELWHCSEKFREAIDHGKQAASS